jgi:Lon protease-like protein
MNQQQMDLIGFRGIARLFPLPNLVFFPNVMQPLHIFEPRYRQMTADALADDKLIALVLPRPGWEKDYAGKPSIYDVACLGKIVADQKLEDGRYNLLLRGMSRIRIVEEVPTIKLYRSAKVELLDDHAGCDAETEATLRRQFHDLAPRMFPQSGEVKAEFRKILLGATDLGTLTDIVAFALPLGAEVKQGLLAEIDVRRRALTLAAYLEAHAPPAEDDRTFPPPFSAN